MKKTFTLSLLASIALGFTANVSAEVVTPDSTGFQFKDIKVIAGTPIKDQYKSGTCWCYSTNSFFEAELLRKTGKMYDLSQGFVVYHCYLDKAIKYIRMDGTINFAEGGSTLDVPYVWKKYGMVPQSVYSGMVGGEDKFNFAEMTPVLTQYLETINKRKLGKLSPNWVQGFQGLLDSYMGKAPTTFTYQGKTYTPESYAASLPLNMDDYIGIASFTHHPFYKPFILEVADNWLWGEYQNVPIEELKAIVDNAIDNGYPVEWAADVSEKHFKYRLGYAILPVEKKGSDLKGSDYARWAQLTDKEQEQELEKIKGPVEEQKVTQESRQAGFDNKETTDDHGMVIVGRAVDQKGNKYYKVQNSWSTNQLYNGYFYVSEAYFMAKTMDIYLHKDAIPTAIAKKMGLKK